MCVCVCVCVCVSDQLTAFSRVLEVELDCQVSLVIMVQKESMEILDREVHLVLVARELVHFVVAYSPNSPMCC